MKTFGIGLKIQGAPCSAVCSRHCTMSLTAVGSIPDGVTRIFHYNNPPSRAMGLESIYPLTELCTRNIFLGVGGKVKAAGG